ncbi:MAG TPA: low molecular weight phosphatase family protein [Deltaproteobacteria bacterium]|nr:low molecular weight phosphatase family protein [Deltaproteobacteria bacterium]
MALKLLFICSGNITRSPVAAALAEQLALELSIEADIQSAGTLGISGRPAHPRMIAVAREVGLDLTGHVSQGVNTSLVGWADRILVMELIHAAVVEALDPTVTERVIQLGPLISEARIDDPTGSWFNRPYRNTRDKLASAVRRFLSARALDQA